MKRKRTSIIWKLSKEEFQTLVNECYSLADILRKFNLHVGAGNYKTLRKRIKEEEINLVNITLGLNSNKGRKFGKGYKQAIPLEVVLVENSTYSRAHLKTRLLKEGLLKNKCYVCEMEAYWNGKILSLTIDHINGISNDNRLDNLRMLCPNCHSQTETFSGKHHRKNKIIKNNCVDCNKKLSSNLCIRCRDCNFRIQSENQVLNHKTKIEWPENLILVELVNQTSFKAVSRKLGVSDNAIRKRLKNVNMLHLTNQ